MQNWQQKESIRISIQFKGDLKMSNSNKMQDQAGTSSQNQNWYSGLTESFRDLVGIQVRTAHAMMDKTLGLGQTWTDFMQTQMHEGMKLSQECVKYGWTLTENLKRSTFEATDRAFRASGS